MPCFHPIRGYRGDDGVVRFNQVRQDGDTVELPCGRCQGCRLQRSREWAVRCVNEAQMHDANCYITLTYDDHNVPPGHSLRYSDFQLFMRRLRLHVRREDRKLKRTPPRRVRFFMSGEYGDDNSRPHFHALLFGFDFPEQAVISNKRGHPLYRSALLERLWPMGFSSIGRVTFESAAYVARYVMKKVTGDAAEAHYRVCDPSTGEIVDRVPEFCHMSLKPGVGAAWLDRYFSDVYPHGKIVAGGHEMKPPRYYERRFAKADPNGWEDLAWTRLQLVRPEDNTASRLAVREQVVSARLRSLKRSL